MDIQTMKIGTLRGVNVLVKVVNKNITKKIKGTDVVLKNENLAFPTAEIVAVGKDADPALKVGMKVLVFAQSLGMNLDNDALPYNNTVDKTYLYFIVFDSQIEAILELDETDNVDEVSV